MTVRNQWGMCCPSCGDDDTITIAALSWVVLVEDGTDSDAAFDGHEWDSSSPCHCGCGWTGTVADAEKAGAAANELPITCSIEPFDSGWRYVFQGDDDDAPLVFDTYLDAAEAAARIR